MKKMLLIASLGLIGLSVQASFFSKPIDDWRTVENTERAEVLAREYFWNNATLVTIDDISRAMKKFPTFLTWEDCSEYLDLEDPVKFVLSKAGKDCHEYGTLGTVTHYIAANHHDPEVLRHLLAFSPDLEVVNGDGYTPREVCVEENLLRVFEEYGRKPRVNSEKKTGRSTHFSDEAAEENGSTLSSFLTWKTIGGIGAVALLGIAFNYYRGSSKEAKK